MKKTILSICMITAAYCVSAQTVSTTDTQFANNAAQAGMLEVKLGELASTKGTSADVKMLGKHMVTDHTKAGNELKGLAATKKIALPTELNSEGQMHYDELSKKLGADFDKAYSDLMVKDHEKAVALFKMESTEGSDTDLKKWATNTLPTLKHHLMMAQETDAKVKK